MAYIKEEHPLSGYVLWISVILPIYIVSLLLRWDTLSKARGIPSLDDKKGWEYFNTNAKLRFLKDGDNIVRAGLAKFCSFYTITERGPRLILSGKYADELKKHDNHLSHTKSLEEDWLTRIPGFEPFTNGKRHRVTNDMVMRLTRSLPKVTVPVSEETTAALRAIWTDVPEWHEINLLQVLVQTIAQVSTRVFIGPELCRDPEWLRLSTEYPIEAFTAAQILHQWPPFLHNYIHWFLPSARKLRMRQSQASTILLPILEKRREADETARREGKQSEREFNLLDIVDEYCRKDGDYSPVISQLGFSFAAVHSTSDLISKTILDLCRHPEMIEPLRQEIITVIGQEGWQKSGVLKLKLLDSVLKESQRMSPVSTLSMRRKATADIKLEDGTEIPKGTILAVSCDQMFDSSTYPDAGTYDGYRFYKIRQDPGLEHKANLVATSGDHMGFGHGKHACPGRFFAANEAKVVLSHMLLKYDWKLVDEDLPFIETMGTFPSVNHRIKIAIRRRKEEIVL